MEPEHLAWCQIGLVAHWQLLVAGLTDDAIAHWSRGLRRPFDGVYLTGCGPLTRDQRWWAATLTTPDSSLAGPSAAAFHRLRDDPVGPVTIVRPGSGGPVPMDGLIVRRSQTVAGHISTAGGPRVTTVERTLVDEWGRLRSPRARERLVREALRIGATTSGRTLLAVGEHRGVRGVARLRAYVRQFSHLPFERCRSDAECQGLVVLDEAGIDLPLVNVMVAGGEADFFWPGRGHIVEIDGPQYHRLTDRDRAKERAWRAAGLTVQRVASGAVYDAPWMLVNAATPR